MSLRRIWSGLAALSLVACGSALEDDQEGYGVNARGVGLLLPAVQAPPDETKGDVTNVGTVKTDPTDQAQVLPGCGADSDGNVHLYGDYFLNDQAFPESDYEDALVYLREVPGERLILLGNTHDGSYASAVPPGNYQVVYDRQSGGAIVPRNSMANIGDPIAVTTAAQIDIHVAAVNAGGAFLHNGEAFPDTIYDNAEISLVRGGEPPIALGNTRDQAYETVLLPGTYSALYAVVLSNGQVPQNELAVISEDIDMSETCNVDLNVHSRRLDLTLTKNGQAFPTSIYHQATVGLQDTSTRAIWSLGGTSDPKLNPLLVAGDYRVVYSHAIGDVPLNVGATLSPLAVPSIYPFVDEELRETLEVPSVAVSGQFLSASPTGLALLEGYYWLVPSDSAPAFQLGSGTSYEAELLPGTYQVIHSFHANAEQALLEHTVIEPAWQVTGVALQRDFALPTSQAVLVLPASGASRKN